MIIHQPRYSISNLVLYTSPSAILKSTLIISPYIDFIVTSEEAGVEKPTPHLFELCVEKAGVPAGECAFIGDNLTKDVKGAWDNGLKGIWYTKWIEQQEETEYPVIQSFDEVDVEEFLK